LPLQHKTATICSGSRYPNIIGIGTYIIYTDETISWEQRLS
jgi:hypothetical protein